MQSVLSPSLNQKSPDISFVACESDELVLLFFLQPDSRKIKRDRVIMVQMLFKVRFYKILKGSFRRIFNP